MDSKLRKKQPNSILGFGWYTYSKLSRNRTIKIKEQSSLL